MEHRFIVTLIIAAFFACAFTVAMKDDNRRSADWAGQPSALKKTITAREDRPDRTLHSLPPSLVRMADRMLAALLEHGRALLLVSGMLLLAFCAGVKLHHKFTGPPELPR